MKNRHFTLKQIRKIYVKRMTQLLHRTRNFLNPMFYMTQIVPWNWKVIIFQKRRQATTIFVINIINRNYNGTIKIISIRKVEKL